MGTLKDKIEGLEKKEIIEAMNECNRVMARAARKLGITERMIGYKVKKCGIRKEEKAGIGSQGSGAGTEYEFRRTNYEEGESK